MAELPKPRVLISACLLGDEVRYDGGSAREDFALRLSQHVEAVKVCPELDMGLGVPREKIILVQESDQLRAVQQGTGRLLTKDLTEIALRIARESGPLDGILLKSRSPSCGVSGTKIYADSGGRKLIGRGRGIFASKLMDLFRDIPIEDEERLRRYPSLRLRFLLALWLSTLKRHGLHHQFLKGKDPLSLAKRLKTVEVERVLREILGEDRLKEILKT